MRITEKLQFIQDHYFSEWLRTRSKVEEELSNNQSTFCICDRLATGLHESCCKKFNDAVTKKTLKELKYLLPIG